MIEEYYPSLDTILEIVRDEIVLVGSATKKDLIRCKDIDFVISEKGYKNLKEHKFFYYCLEEEPGWIVFISEGWPMGCAVEFFLEKCDITDKWKHKDRITYEEAMGMDLVVKTIGLTEVFSIS